MGSLTLNTTNGAINLVPADGSGTQTLNIGRQPNLGKVLQIVRSNYSSTNSTSTTSQSYVDSGLSITITPTSVTSKIDVTFSGNCHRNASGDGIMFSIFRDGTNLHQNNSYSAGTFVYGNTGSDEYVYFSVNKLNVANTTNAITYKLYFRSWNGNQAGINWHAGELVMNATEIAN